MMQEQLARHWPRLTLALLWAVGGEILAWSFAPNRPLLDWLLILLGYVALGYALTDLAARWRIRDLYGVAALGGVAGLIYGLLMNPAFALEEIPRTLVTRVLGMQSLILMGMTLLWLLLLDRLPLRWITLPIAALMGLCWGTWVRHAPINTALAAPIIDIDTFTIVGLAVAGVVLLLVYLGSRLPSAKPESLLLTPYESAFCAIVLIATLYRQFDLDTIDMVSRGIVVGLMGLTLAMMWFRKDSTYGYLAQPVQLRPAWGILAAGLVAFLVCASAAFGAPTFGTEAFSQLEAVVLLFGLFGLTWVPGVAAILGLRAVLREVSATQL